MQPPVIDCAAAGFYLEAPAVSNVFSLMLPSQYARESALLPAGINRSLRISAAFHRVDPMKCPHCNALFAHPHATEAHAEVSDEKSADKGSTTEVTVFTCPVCEAVFSVHPGDLETLAAKVALE